MFNISVACHNLLSNTEDAFHSDFCFIDMVNFVKVACRVEFQGAYFLGGKRNSEIAPGKLSAPRKPALFCSNDYIIIDLHNLAGFRVAGSILLPS